MTTSRRSDRLVAVAAVAVLLLSVVAVSSIAGVRVEAAQQPTDGGTPNGTLTTTAPVAETTAPVAETTKTPVAQTTVRNGTQTTNRTRTTTTRDTDGDGIPDAVDACDNKPETFNGFRDRDGCPDHVMTTRAS